LHLGTQSFAAEGRVSGYYADSGVRNLDIHGATHALFTRYLVSMFPSVAQAATAFAQQRDGWDTVINDPTSPINGQLTPESLQVGDQMSKGVYQAQVKTSAGTEVLSELLFQRGPYFIEVWQDVLQKDVAKYASGDRPYMLTVAKALDTIASGKRLPALPKPAVKIHMQSVRFEANNSKASLTKSPLKSVKTGSKVQLGAYFALTSAPARSQVKSDYTLTLGKRTLHKAYKHTLGAYPPDYYHEGVYNVSVPRAGTYHLRIVMSIGKVSTSGTASLTVSTKGLATLSVSSSASITAAPRVMARAVKTVLRDDVTGAAALQEIARSAVAR
jgi:hypothetical protein